MPLTDVGEYSFGVTVKALRRRAGLSQLALGEAIGVTQQLISQFE
jgi:transcriptional regulator with XRE-family HTH domain